MPTTKQLKKDRYPGIRSFEADDERLFYGRTKEIDDLFSLVVIKPLVVLFSKSGLGKSSLLKAGLGPVLVKNAFFPILIRVQDTGVSPVDMVISELKPFIDENRLKQFGGQSTNRIWEALKACNFVDHDGNPIIPVLVFDQFEELFNHKKAEQNQWATQLADLIEGRLPKDSVEALQEIPRRQRTPEQLDWFRPPAVKMVFAIRSDRMSELHQLRKEIPGILQNRYELKPLHSAQSGEAIIKPATLIGAEFTTKPFTFAPQTVKDIQSNLSNESGEIESFQLQIVCQHIEKKIKEQESKGKQNIQATPDFIGGKEGILGILKNYYDNHITNLGTEEDQLAVRKLLEEGLIVDGRRIGVADAVVKGTFGISDELLGKLLESRLIRPENTRLGRTFEISHDTLVAPIVKAYDKRRRAEERMAKQKELEERERQLAIEQKKRIFYYKIAAFTGTLSLVAIGAFGFAYHHYKKAKVAENSALEEKRAAEESDALSQQIINSLYFYGDSLALATKKDDYGRTMYGFIDKKGITRIDYVFTEATPFDDETGYSKVTRMGEKHLLWPDKTEYRLADNLNRLNSTITALDLEDNQLKVIPKSIYKNPQLKVLLLASNFFEDIPSEIENLTDLQSLNLTKNQLKRVPEQIGKLKNLEQLYLNGNKLENLPPEIASLSKLKRLNLYSNKIKYLPHQIEKLSALESLDLGENELKSLPPQIRALVNLRELSLSGNEMINFPPEIGKLVNLEVLILHRTGLQYFPKEIIDLVLLEELDLSRNTLEGLPPEIEKLENLEELFLHGNDLKSLPVAIGKLVNLKTLHLGFNSLDSLPSEIESLSLLVKLNLTENLFESLPVELGKLLNLRELYLHSNKLSSLPPEIGNLVQLEQLTLSANPLNSLPPEIGNLINLKKLDLSSTKLNSLPPQIGNLKNLRELNLLDNLLSILPAEIVNLVNLEKLNLGLNELKGLPAEIKKLKHLRSLDLRGNIISEKEKDSIRKLLPNCEIQF